MITRSSEAEWKGDLKAGGGTVKFGSGAFSGAYSFKTRFESAPGTNPEEMIAAAHSACFSMAFSLMLSQAGFVPTSVHTVAKVNLEQDPGGFSITSINLKTDGVVPNIDKAKFLELAEQAKKGCPISKALSAVKITLEATLK